MACRTDGGGGTAMATGLGGRIFATGQAGDALGARIVPVGDWNGDGFGDVAVSAPDVDRDGAAGAGAVFVIWGTPDAAGQAGAVTLSPGGEGAMAILGAEADGAFGRALAAGDLDGDGAGDLLVGAPGPSGADGRAYALYAPAGAVVAVETLDAGAVTRFGARPGSEAGAVVAGLGDIGGDGLGDLLVASAGDGRAYVLQGDGAAHPAALNLTADYDTQRILFTGLAGFAGAAGDLNGDRIGDLFLSRAAEAEGGIVAVFGTELLGGASINLGTFAPDGTNGLLIATEGAATAVAAGDVDGDGIGDILAADGRGAFLVRGRAGAYPAVIDPVALPPGAGTRFVGAVATVDMGGTGDADGDGQRDLALVGADGALYLVFGRAGGLPPVVDLSALDGRTGYRIAGAPDEGAGAVRLADLNGDGFADLVAGLGDRDGGAGAVAVVYGGKGRLTALDGTDGAFDGRIDLGRLGQVLTFTETGPVPPGGSSGRDAPTAYGDDLIGTDGGDGIDLLTGDDTFAALSGDDSVWGGGGDDLIFADGGNDRVWGDAGDDRLEGRSGADRLDGGPGGDRMAGGDGNDTLSVDSARDVVIEERFGGIDWLHASVSRALPAEIEHLRLTGTAAIDGRGNSGANLVIGNDAANTLWGLRGADTITAGRGADTIIGGAGSDRLIAGRDGSVDRFIVEAAAHSPRGYPSDRIAGFERGRDRLDLRLIDADADRRGSQDLDFNGRRPEAHALWFVETVNGLRLFADTTGDLRPEMEIKFDDVFRLTAQDFLL